MHATRLPAAQSWNALRLTKKKMNVAMIQVRLRPTVKDLYASMAGASMA
ncbi:unnamed protein product [marine sediment metagenome]|uniref:Uncharacterized protein n=1 Tax=marine sediment metagenome TaxID=412755 RepID=X0W5N1_9ZZZZ